MRLKLPSFSSALSFRLALAALLVSSATVSTPGAHAQSQTSATPLATPAIRITGNVSNDALVTLKGNTHPMAKSRYDQGAASTSLATGRMQLLFKRSPAQQSALTQYLGSLQDPHSANYRKWLTPEAYGASFGIADQDLQTVEAWLQGQGFKIEAVPASRNLIQFSGTAGQVTQAFHTSIHTYLVNGVKHVSNATDPEIPAALAPVIAGVSPLNDFHAKPLNIPGGHAQVQRSNGSLQLVANNPSGTRPLATDTVNSGPFLLVTPSDAATIYNAPNSLNRNFTGTTQQTGTNVNIGVIEDSDLSTADYANYRKVFLGETSPVAPTLVVDGRDPGILNGGSADEALLDAELAAGLAPKANIFVYSSADSALEDGVYNAALRAIEDNNIAVMSVSFGNCEVDLGTSGNAEIAELWQQAAAQGITVVAATGDSGSAACDTDPNESQATSGLQVSGFASTPYNVAVGGTDFDALLSSFSTYVTAASGQNNLFGTALNYIPENPWNDSISNTTPGSYTTDTAKQYPIGGSSSTYTILEGTGGGASNAAGCSGNLDSNGNCVGTLLGYAAPSFQTGLTLPAGAPTGVRTIPDVSFFAAPGNTHPAAWAFCSDNVTDGTATAFTDCSPDATGSFNISGIGGTSASTPAFAGMLGMVLQSLSTTNVTRLGLANNTIYNLFATSANSASIFHDITAGNNSVPCQAGSPNCSTNGFLQGFDAAAGYDLASGLGSVDLTQLITAWGQVQFTPSSVTLAVNNATSAINVVHGTTVTLSTQVSPAAATGSVAVTATTTGQAGAAVNQLIPLTSGAGSITTNQLPGGNYSLQAYYQGDVKDSPSTSSQPIPVVVTPEASTPFLSLGIYDVSTGNAITNNPVAYGEYGYAYVEPANTSAGNTNGPFNGIATGTVTFLNNGATLSTATLNSQGLASYPLYNLAPGSYALGASYSGDNSYNSSATSTNTSLVITKSTPTGLTVHTGIAAVSPAAASTLLVELDTNSVGAVPTGSVTLSLNGKALVAGAPTQIALSDGAVGEQVTFTVPAGTLLTSGNSVAATYAGDTNYNGTTATTCAYTPIVATASLTAPVHSGLSPRGMLAAGSGMVLCSALFFAIPARRRAWRSMLVLFLAIGILGAVGCGSSNSNSGSGGGGGGSGPPVGTLPACAQ